MDGRTDGRVVVSCPDHVTATFVLIERAKRNPPAALSWPLSYVYMTYVLYACPTALNWAILLGVDAELNASTLMPIVGGRGDPWLLSILYIMAETTDWIWCLVCLRFFSTRVFTKLYIVYTVWLVEMLSTGLEDVDRSGYHKQGWFFLASRTVGAAKKYFEKSYPRCTMMYVSIQMGGWCIQNIVTILNSSLGR